MNTNIFAMPIKEIIMPNFDQIAQDAIDKVLPLFDEDCVHDFSEDGNLSLYYKNNRLADSVDLSPIINFVNEQAQIYWSSLNYSKFLKPYVLNSWANITRPGGRVMSHTHSPAPLTGVIYLKATPGMGNLIIEHPLETVLACQPYEFDFKPKLFGHEVVSETGKLVIFPGYLRHRTQVNNSNETRVVIGFNIGCRGQVNYIHLF